MARWQPIQLVGGAYADDALPWSAQDCINYIPVPAEKEGARSREMLRCLPGYTLFCDLGTGKPIRGARNVEGRLFVVSGTTLYQVSPDGTATSRGTIPGVKRCSLSHNQITGGNEVVISNGQGGYIYNTASNTLAQITDDGFPGAISFDFVDGYILGIEPARRFAFTSDLADAGSYNTIDRYEAEGSPDLLVGQAVTHREWWLMGERTIEPFVNTGETTGTFQRSQGTVIEVGLAGTHAVATMDNSVFWLGNDGIVYRANGYTPQRISTHAIEQAISRCKTAQAFAFTFEDRGHKVFYLTFPDGHTWGYDAATGEWHRRQSHNLDRWRINTLTRWNGKWIAGDFSDGKLYQLDWDVQHEAGVPMERRRIPGVTHDNQNALIINGIELVVDTGGEVGKGLPAISLSGDLQDSAVGVSGTFAYTSNTSVPLTFSIKSGSLPPGAEMDEHGVVTFDYTTGGNYAWVVKAIDAYGRVATLSDSCNIIDLSDATALTSSSVLLHSLSSANLHSITSAGPSVRSSGTAAGAILARLKSISTEFPIGTSLGCGKAIVSKMDGTELAVLGWHGPDANLAELNRELAIKGMTPISSLVPSPQYQTISPSVDSQYTVTLYAGASSGSASNEQCYIEYVSNSSLPTGSTLLDIPGVVGYAQAPDGTLYKAPWATP